MTQCFGLGCSERQTLNVRVKLCIQREAERMELVGIPLSAGTLPIKLH